MTPGRIAGWGYEVVVPDLYLDGRARRHLVATIRALSTGKGEALVDIETSRQWLLAQPETTEAVGIIGFCMGGGFALLTCDRGRYAVASVNYGTVPEDVGHACPVVGAYGARDLPPWLRCGTWRVSGHPRGPRARVAEDRGLLRGAPGCFCVSV